MRLGPRQRLPEQRHALLQASAPSSPAAKGAPAALHPAPTPCPPFGPRAPRKALRRQSLRVTVRRERIEEAVRRCVVALTRRAQQAGQPRRRARRRQARAPPSARADATPRPPSATAREQSARRSAPPSTPSSSTPAACTTPRSGHAGGIASTTALSPSRSATSTAATVTRAPSASSSATASTAPGVSTPRRPVSTTCATPSRASHRATCSPSAPRPPVTSTVLSLGTRPVRGGTSASLPTCRACPMNRNAASASVTGYVRTGSARRCPAANAALTSASISRIRSGPVVGQLEGPVAHPGMRCGDRGRVAQIGLAHLQQSPARRQQRQAGVHELPGQRVQHNVHATARAALPQRRGKLQRPRARYLRHSHRADHGPLRRAGRRYHLRTHHPADLHRRHAHTAGRRVHKQPFARLQLPEVVQRVPRRQERYRNRRRLLVRQPRGHLRHQPRVHRDEPTEGPWAQRHHRIAHGQALNTLAQAHHLAGTFTAQRPGLARVHAQRIEDIAEVEPRGPHLDLHLPRPRNTPLRGRQVQRIQRAFPPRLELIVLGPRHPIVRLGPHKPRAVPAAGAPRHLVFPVARQNLAAPAPPDALGPWREVDQRAAELRVLLHHRPAQAPDRRRGDLPPSRPPRPPPRPWSPTTAVPAHGLVAAPAPPRGLRCATRCAASATSSAAPASQRQTTPATGDTAASAALSPEGSVLTHGPSRATSSAAVPRTPPPPPPPSSRRAAPRRRVGQRRFPPLQPIERLGRRLRARSPQRLPICAPEPQLRHLRHHRSGCVDQRYIRHHPRAAAVEPNMHPRCLHPGLVHGKAADLEGQRELP